MAVKAIRAMYPDIIIQVRKLRTTGDNDLRTSLVNLDSSVFVKELEQALSEHRIDLAVHSLKDVPCDMPAGLTLCAVLPREDPRDALVAGCRLKELPASACIGTDSLRRTAQILRCRPDLRTGSLRGNIETRLRKWQLNTYDGVIIAAAALKRLGLADQIKEYLETADFVPSPGQGAIALETRIDDRSLNERLRSLSDPATWTCISAERAFLKALGGGCRAPLGALGNIADDTISLRGFVSSPDGQQSLVEHLSGAIAEPQALGQSLARKMLSLGAANLIMNGLNNG
jgi:hydroxymethylbilane synthase